MKLLQRAGIVAGILVLLCIVGIGAIYLSGNQFTVAPCIVTTNGQLFMVYEDRPVALNQNAKNYQTGDILLILHASAFAESYPEQAGTHLVMKLASGTKADIPQKALDVLTETGNWIDGEMPENTSLEFWITQNVDNVDWSGYDGITGWFGAKEYLGRGYRKVHDGPGGGRHPEHYVSYKLTAWPDYADGGWFVTQITVTDPAVRVCGLTVTSSYDEFKQTFESLGFTVYQNATGDWIGEKDGITCQMVINDTPESGLVIQDTVPVLIITAEVTNREGIVF